MEMKLLSSRPLAAAKVRFLTQETLGSLEEAVRRVQSPQCGAVVTFSGCVRNAEKDQPIKAIVYDAYLEMAEAEFAKLVQETEGRWPVKIWVQHRLGTVPVQEPSVIIACAGPHRKEAFEACQFVIDRLKADVPIWKVRYEK